MITKKIIVMKLIVGTLVIAALGSSALGQKSKPIIFAVLNDGKILEPIAVVDRNKLVFPPESDKALDKAAILTTRYYKEKTKYKFIFGGKVNGTVTIESFNPAAECTSKMAQVSVSTRRVNLRGFVMGLSTDHETTKAGSGVRRLPSRSERSEIEALVRSEFLKNKISKTDLGKLKYHNLTAIDVDGDGSAEQVGTFFIPVSAKSRAMLFFIAQKEIDGKYYFGHSEFEVINEDKVMSGNIKDLDDGIYHELLLDIFDYDNDGVGEIFTYSQAFEGNHFKAYKRDGKKWIKSFEGYNYRCGY